jgi:hypothetical protein
MHRAYLKGNKWDNANRWEPILNNERVAAAVVNASEVRFYAHSIAHQLRVFRETGRTGEWVSHG